MKTQMNIIYSNIDNLLDTSIVILRVILTILSVTAFFSLQGFSGSLHSAFRNGDPFMRSQPSNVNIISSRINNTEQLSQLGYTPDPGPCRYVFMT